MPTLTSIFKPPRSEVVPKNYDRDCTQLVRGAKDFNNNDFNNHEFVVFFEFVVF
jgi:hypothetical protein